MRTIQSSMLFLLLTTLFVVLPYFVVKLLGINLGDVDALSYLGAVIGGLLTLASVILTIKHSTKTINLTLEKEQNRFFVERFPKKISALNNLEITVMEMLQENQENKYLSDIEGLKKISEFQDKYSTRLLQEAAEVDGQVYYKVMEIVDSFGYVRSLLRKGHGESLYQSKGAPASELYLKLIGIHSYIKMYKSSLGEHFIELTKYEHEFILKDPNLFSKDFNEYQRKQTKLKKIRSLLNIFSRFNGKS